MYVYLAVSQDKYELPTAVADSAEELSLMLGLSKSTVASHISLVKKGKIKKQRYFRIKINGKGEEESE